MTLIMLAVLPIIVINTSMKNMSNTTVKNLDSMEFHRSPKSQIAFKFVIAPIYKLIPGIFFSVVFVSLVGWAINFEIDKTFVCPAVVGANCKPTAIGELYAMIGLILISLTMFSSVYSTYSVLKEKNLSRNAIIGRYALIVATMCAVVFLATKLFPVFIAGLIMVLLINLLSMWHFSLLVNLPVKSTVEQI